MGQKSADFFLSSYNIGKVPVYDARDFPIIGEVEPSSMKHPLLHVSDKMHNKLSSNCDFRNSPSSKKPSTVSKETSTNKPTSKTLIASQKFCIRPTF